MSEFAPAADRVAHGTRKAAQPQAARPPWNHGSPGRDQAPPSQQATTAQAAGGNSGGCSQSGDPDQAAGRPRKAAPAIHAPGPL
jgi:hypothetical protein